MPHTTHYPFCRFLGSEVLKNAIIAGVLTGLLKGVHDKLVIWISRSRNYLFVYDLVHKLLQLLIVQS